MAQRLNAVFLPGMGADRRLYSGVDLPGVNLIFIDWEAPRVNDDLRSYSKRIAQKLPQENLVLIGSSFGGIVALEIARCIPPLQVFLLGAPSEPSHFSKSVKLLFKIPTPKEEWVKAVPASMVTSFMQVKETGQREIFKEMLASTPSSFLVFAMRELKRWKAQYETPVTHILGDRDWIVSLPNQLEIETIVGGGHCIALEKPALVSRIISSKLEHLAVR